MLVGIGPGGQLAGDGSLREQIGVGNQGVHRIDGAVQVVLDGVEVAVVGVGDLGRDVATGDVVDIVSGNVQRANHRIKGVIDTGYHALEITFMFAGIGPRCQFAGDGSLGQQFGIGHHALNRALYGFDGPHDIAHFVIGIRFEIKLEIAFGHFLGRCAQPVHRRHNLDEQQPAHQHGKEHGNQRNDEKCAFQGLRVRHAVGHLLRCPFVEQHKKLVNRRHDPGLVGVVFLAVHQVSRQFQIGGAHDGVIAFAVVKASLDGVHGLDFGLYQFVRVGGRLVQLGEFLGREAGFLHQALQGFGDRIRTRLGLAGGNKVPVNAVIFGGPGFFAIANIENVVVLLLVLRQAAAHHIGSAQARQVVGALAQFVGQQIRGIAFSLAGRGCGIRPGGQFGQDRDRNQEKNDRSEGNDQQATNRQVFQFFLPFG